MTVHGGIAAGLRLGNLGFKVKGVSAQQVFDDPEYFKEILKRNKVIGFIGMHPSGTEHSRLVNCLYSGVDDPEYSEGLLSDQNHQKIEGVEDRENPEEFLASQWHSDNPFLDEPPCVMAIHMTTYKVDPEFGHTFFVSLTDLYEQCPDHIKPHLDNAYFCPTTGSEDKEVTNHRALRTHPETGETMLYWTGMGTKLVGGNEPWFDELEKFVTNYLANEANRFKWTWSEGDVLAWDNRAVMHGFYPGWERENRIFQRVEVGNETPFYDPSKNSTLNPNFGDTNEFPGVERDATKGPNPDHIPLVFTKGIYALPGLEHLFQKVTVFALSDDGSIPDRVEEFRDHIQMLDDMSHDLVIFPVKIGGDDVIFKNLSRYSNSYAKDQPQNGQVMIFSRNGDLHGGVITAEMDLFKTEPNEDGRLNPIERVRGLLKWHPDMRHAGHAWHYPDWFPHQRNLKFRPWDYHNLSFSTYEDFKGEDPPEDFLVQFAIDSVYGCFNHLKNNEDRRRVVERIRDYIDYMLDLNEHELDR